MKHPDDDLLRRLRDESAEVAKTARLHIAACDRCRRRQARIQGTLSTALSARSTAKRPIKDTRASVFASLAGSLALVSLLALTPIGSYAQNWLTIFEPKHFVGVSVSEADIKELGGIQHLTRYGTLHELSRPQVTDVAGAVSAAAKSHLALRLPASLPSNVPARTRYQVISRGSASFTFSAAKAMRTAASSSGRSMPAQIDGSTLRLTVGPAVVTTFGNRPALRQHRTGRLEAGGDAGIEPSRMPALVVAQSPVPHVTSTRATVRDIIAYLASQPGVPARVASQIKVVSDPSTTLPVPIPIDRAEARQMQVQGVEGLAIGDNTGVGSAVVWEKDGMVYAVAGSLPLSEILDVADSLR